MEQPGRVRKLPPSATETARQLRQRQTIAEEVLWQALRERKLAGLKFRRQQPIGPYFADFYCREHHLVVELDGAIHDAQQDYDAGRTEYLETHGLAVLRFANDDVLNKLPNVLNQILATVSPSPLSPAGERGRG